MSASGENYIKQLNKDIEEHQNKYCKDCKIEHPCSNDDVLNCKRERESRHCTLCGVHVSGSWGEHWATLEHQVRLSTL